jgi:hypothetical protein
MASDAITALAVHADRLLVICTRYREPNRGYRQDGSVLGTVPLIR